MLPAYWPLLVAGVALIILGPLLCARASVVAAWIAPRVHRSPAPAATLFLVRKRPKTQEDTTTYLRDIYRVVGLIWTVMGILLVVVVFVGKPAP